MLTMRKVSIWNHISDHSQEWTLGDLGAALRYAYEFNRPRHGRDCQPPKT